jgi:hypothetical protein
VPQKQQYKLENANAQYHPVNPSLQGILSGMLSSRFGAIFLIAGLFAGGLLGQGSYEIQIYSCDTVDPGATMVQLHGNFTLEGSKSPTDGTFPAEHQLHETLEITCRKTGIRPWASVYRWNSGTSAVYSPDTWTLVIRPIIDKTFGKLYLDLNPTLGRSFHGPSVSQ